MTPVALVPTRSDGIETVLGMEADPDTRPWLGETGPGWHAEALADDGVEHLLARRDGELVGFVVLAAPRGTEPGTELRRIVVDARHRGHGYGRAVLRAAVEHVGGGRIWLDVKPGNVRALALYASEGFTVERELPTLTIMARAA